MQNQAVTFRARCGHTYREEVRLLQVGEVVDGVEVGESKVP